MQSRGNAEKLDPGGILRHPLPEGCAEAHYQECPVEARSQGDLARDTRHMVWGSGFWGMLHFVIVILPASFASPAYAAKQC